MKRLRRFWWQRVRRYRYEMCTICGRPVGVVWTATDRLYLQMMGRFDGDTPCVQCFDDHCQRRGVFLRWIPQGLDDELPFVEQLDRAAAECVQLRERYGELEEAAQTTAEIISGCVGDFPAASHQLAKARSGLEAALRNLQEGLDA